VNLPDRFQSDFITIKNSLQPFTKRAYFVGGAARDYLLGRDFYDVDIEVYDIAPDRFDEIMRSIGAIGVGRSFFVYKIGAFDLSLPRSERKTGRGHNAFMVAWENDPVLASSRRDFTINAIMIDIFNGKLLDFHNGREDLRLKLIRHINDRAFAEDSLRALRAVRFAAQLGFKIAADTIALCRAMALDDLSLERVWSEFERIMNAPYRVRGAYFMIALGVSQKLFGAERADLMLFRAIRRCNNEGFLYALGARWHNTNRLLQAIGAPKRLRRKLLDMPSPPRLPSDRFLAAVALKMPLKEWFGTQVLRLEERAKRLGLFDDVLRANTTAADLMTEGFYGKELGRELRQRALKMLRQYSNEPMPFNSKRSK
jgi:tRNA nucleotidyltransferase (CCA-adding enzyme)